MRQLVGSFNHVAPHDLTDERQEILASRGAAIAVVDLRQEVASRAASEIRRDHGVASIAIGCDTADHSQVAEAVPRTVSELGGLHFAVNAAGLPAYIGHGTFMGDYDAA